MNDVKQLFKIRDEAFRAGTKSILEHMLPVLEGAIEFLKLQVEAQNGNLSWEDVTLFDETDGPYVVVVGVVSYEAGDLATMPSGETVTVTDETAEYFHRLFRIGVPLELATSGTTEEVVYYLQSMEDESEAQLLKELEDIVSNEDEFNLDDLSDDQIEKMKMFSGIDGSRSRS